MMTTRLRPAAGSFAMDVFSERPVFATAALPRLCRLRSRAGLWPEQPLPSWTSLRRIGCHCRGLVLSRVTSVRGDERSWLASGARVTINGICSHSVNLGENRTRSDGGGPLQAAQEKSDRVGLKQACPRDNAFSSWIDPERLPAATEREGAGTEQKVSPRKSRLLAEYLEEWRSRHDSNMRPTV
jgi:hypothetical protein